MSDLRQQNNQVYDLQPKSMVCRGRQYLVPVYQYTCQCYQFLYQSKSINVLSFLRKHLTQRCSSITIADLQRSNI